MQHFGAFVFLTPTPRAPREYPWALGGHASRKHTLKPFGSAPEFLGGWRHKICHASRKHDLKPFEIATEYLSGWLK